MTLTIVVLHRAVLRLIIILLLFPINGFCKRGGYLNFQFLCYQNPDHLDHTGYACDTLPSKNCDPLFVICISNKRINGESPENCPVYYLMTESFNNEESVCYSPSDNRGILTKIPEIELPYPLQEIYFVRIVVKDSNQFSAHQYIAVFYASFSGAPSPNFNTVKNTEIFMDREELKVRNPQAKLKISIGLKCDWNLYGKLCAVFCKSTETDHYICSEKGDKICKLGWRGVECLMKDSCRDFRCAQGASCVYLNGVPKCNCNGMIGPQCYPDYNPCLPNPCLNGGVCVPESFLAGGISCNCRSPYHGSRCNLKFDLCQMDPCQNNGTCDFNENGKRICKCPPEYIGVLCDHKLYGTTSFKLVVTTNEIIPIAGYKIEKGKNFEVIFGVLFGLCAFVLIIVGIYFFIVWRQKKIFSINQKNGNCLKDLPQKSQSVRLSNDYGLCKDDTIYDTIDERATYVYQIDNNDDYLVPSRPTTPLAPNTPGTGRSSTSDYIQMSPNYDGYSPDELTTVNTKENEYLPPLPTRTATKKHFLLCRNFKI